MTDYLIGHENTTVVYNCIQPVSISLLVTLLDFDENTVIKPFNMRSGIGQNSNSTPLIQTESRHMEYQMNKTNFLISMVRAELELLHSTTLSLQLSRPRLFLLLPMLEIWKLTLFIWYSMCRDSVCVRGVVLVGWIPGFLRFSNSGNETWIGIAQIVELQKSFLIIPNSNLFHGNWKSKI